MLPTVLTLEYGGYLVQASAVRMEKYWCPEFEISDAKGRVMAPLQRPAIGVYHNSKVATEKAVQCAIEEINSWLRDVYWGAPDVTAADDDGMLNLG